MVVDGLEVRMGWAAVGTVQDRLGFMLVSCIGASGVALRGGAAGDGMI